MSDRRELSKQRFGDFAQNYVTSNVHGSGYTLERLTTLVEPGPGKRALDIATGGGHTALALARQGATVIASDLTPRMLKAARKHIGEQNPPGEVTYAAVDASALPFPDNALDIVTCRIAPHHFPDVAQFVREAARVVRPGGVVGIVDQIGPTEPEAARYVNSVERLRDPSHNWQYSKPEWESFLGGVGLHLINSETTTLRFELKWWMDMQHCDAETIMRVRVMIEQAPRPVAQWLDAHVTEDPSQFTFAHHYVVLIGRKPA